MPQPDDDDLTTVGVLTEPARRRLYDYVAGEPSAVSREQAAEALAMPVHSVKFHLDKLVVAGLLEVEYRRLTGRTGPGAGRPAKLYRRSARELSVSLPARSYDVAASLLAAGIERADRDRVPVVDAVRTVAREEGLRVAVEPHPGLGDEGRGDRDRVTAVLGAHGYEPRVDGDAVRLANCPFDQLAAEHTALVCGMNLALVDGVLEGLGIRALRARLEPAPGACCVRVAP